jgi:hypothetical protein
MSEDLRPKNWRELAERLRLYAVSVSTLGGMNDLDHALHMAAEGIETYAPKETNL